MRYVFDHDLHIHTHLSLCSGDPAENTARILAYARKYDLKTICITDHFWDESVPGAENFGFYSVQNYEHIAASLPLPESGDIRYLFGCETDLKQDCTLGVAKETFDKFAFVIIPTTHLHMNGFTVRGNEDAFERAKLWETRLDAVLDMDLPFRKIGIAHLTCSLMGQNCYVETMRNITNEVYHRIFSRCAEKGVGIELNFDSLHMTEEQEPEILRPYRIAKEEGCRFYFGSDAHTPKELDAEKANAEHIIDLLSLEEKDKFHINAL